MTIDWQDYVSGIAPNFLRRASGSLILKLIGSVADNAQAEVQAGVDARFPSRSDPSTYSEYLDSRDLPIVTGESSSNTLARTLAAFESHRLSGTDEGLLSILRSFGIGNIVSPLGLPTVRVKTQREFGPSWNVERYSGLALPSWLSVNGSSYVISSPVVSGFLNGSSRLGTFEVKVRWNVTSSSISGTEYIWYINANNYLAFSGANQRNILCVKGSTSLCQSDSFAANDVVSYRFRQDSTNTSLWTSSSGNANIWSGAATTFSSSAIYLASNSTGSLGSKSFVAVSSGCPSPDPSLGWASAWILIDGSSENFSGNAVSSQSLGSRLVGLNTYGSEDRQWSSADISALKAAIRKVKASHLTLPYIAIFRRDLQQFGFDQGIIESTRTALANWSAFDLDRTLMIEIDGMNLG